MLAASLSLSPFVAGLVCKDKRLCRTDAGSESSRSPSLLLASAVVFARVFASSSLALVSASLAPLVPRHIMIDQTSSSFLPRPPAGDPLSSRFCLYTLQRQQQHQRRRQPPWREKITCYLQQHLLPKHSPTFIIKVLFLSGPSFAQPFSPALRLSSCHRMWIK